MEQATIADKIREAKKYDAEKYLAEAAKLLERNKKINIEVADYEWFVIAYDLIFKIIYSVDGNTVTLLVTEPVFKDYQRQFDTKIGIKPEMKMESKIVLRLAYLLYMHREDREDRED